MIRGVIFDLGWTLVDFAGDIAAADAQRAAALETFLSGRGFRVDGAALWAAFEAEMKALRQTHWPRLEEVSARDGLTRALRQVLDGRHAESLAADALAASFDDIVARWRLYPDALETLAALRERGYRLGAISNTDDGAHVWRIVDRCGLRVWLSPIYMSEEIGLCKPHPRLFQMVLEEWRMPPEQVVVVGDTLNADVSGAHNAGMRGVWIDRGPVNPWSHNNEHLAAITPDAVIKQLAELPDVLDKLGLPGR